ncbi:MAG: M20/M25/M40 family metallo-hydrolase [Candidatus Omnitrophica bacterium]|nr:M20/M25/M40 family metallo-hydrolase [Candidatus Omnitrophota bacterium]
MLDWQKNNKLRAFIRTICVVLIITFLSYDLSWAGATEVFSPKNWCAAAKPKDFTSIEIPQELGVIKESYISKSNPHKLIIHIQDAHANVEAQENEAKLISYLKDKYSANLVSVEGGFGDFDAKFFREFPKDKKVRNKIARYFLSKSFISGTDYLLITDNSPPAVYGAEDKDLYSTHLAVFKDNQEIVSALNRSLGLLDNAVEALKDKFYSRDLRELDKKTSDFREGRLALEDYLSYLNIASIVNNLDLAGFPSLYRLITSGELERKINFDKAEAERQALIETLARTLERNELEELIKASLDFKSSKLSPADYYTYLEGLAKKSGIAAGSYNNLFTYIKYISLSSGLDNSRVFPEIDELAERLKEKLIASSGQKDIDKLCLMTRILKGLAEINLSPKEYEYFKKSRNDFTRKILAGLFGRYLNNSYVKNLPADDQILSLEKFYSLAHDRDKAIVENSLSRSDREYSANSVILVAGGFHTQGITSILKEKDISYLVIAPNLKTAQEKESTYFSLLKDKRIPLQDVLTDPDTLQIINSISDPQARKLLINYWVARASRYYSYEDLNVQLNRLALSDADKTAVNLALNEIPHQENMVVKESPASRGSSPVKTEKDFFRVISFVLSFGWAATAWADFGHVCHKAISGLQDLVTQPVVIISGICAGIGYMVYRIAKKIFNKGPAPMQRQPEAVPLEIMPPEVYAANRPMQNIMPPVPHVISRPAQNNLPAAAGEISEEIRRLGEFISQASSETLSRSFWPAGPFELPLPMPITEFERLPSDREKIVSILENMQRMMDWADETALHDFEKAVDNARDRTTQEALSGFDRLSNTQIHNLATSGYLAELQREFQQVIDNQAQLMIHSYTPSAQEQTLYVSEEMDQRYPRLPRYLKWLLGNNPGLESDPLIRDFLYAVEMRMMRIPPFPEMVREYSREALYKSLYLNPELAKRLILYLSNGVSEGAVFDEARTQELITQELAPAPEALPEPDIKKITAEKSELRSLEEACNQLTAKLNEQEELARKIEADLRELNESLEEARRQNDAIIIDALNPAAAGLSAKLEREKALLLKLQQEKTEYEDRIKKVKKDLGLDEGTTLYSSSPLTMGVVAVFAAMFGIPLYITKKIIGKYFTTTLAKVFGIGAGIATLIPGYYIYYASLKPQIEQVFVNFPEADWARLASFVIIWPISVIIGTLFGKIGEEVIHEALYDRANSAYKKKDFAKAADLINRAIELREKPEYYALLGDCRFEEKRINAAIEAYESASRLGSKNNLAYNSLGVLYAQTGNDAKAIENYKRSLELKPDNAVVLTNLGRVLHRKGQLLEAARALQRAQEIRPDLSVTEELNQILRQAAGTPKPQQPKDLDYIRTKKASLIIDREKSWLNQLNDKDVLGPLMFLGAVIGWVLGGLFLHYVPYGHHWNLGTSADPSWLGIAVWTGEIIGAPLAGVGLTMPIIWISDKITTFIRQVYRYIKFPHDYKIMQKINIKPSDELSDEDLKRAAPLFARLPKDYLEEIFRSWVEAGHDEKIPRLFKFDNWKSSKIQVYSDIGEYKKAIRAAVVKFTNSQAEQSSLTTEIDSQKERLAQKGIENSIRLLKDILPQVAEHSRTRQEFIYWLNLLVDLPVNVWNQGSKRVLDDFTDLREFKQVQEAVLKKFAHNPQEEERINKVIEKLKSKLNEDGFFSPAGILKTALDEVSKVSRDINEFIFWVNELTQFDKNLFSSGFGYSRRQTGDACLPALQNLVVYERTKEEAAKKFCKDDNEIKTLYQAADSLKKLLREQSFAGNFSILKDIILRVAEVSRSLTEYLDYIAVLKTFDKNIWRSTQTVLQALNNHIDYKKARENAAAKFTHNDSNRQRFLSDVDDLRNQLVQKGFPHASDLLKDVLPELTKTCRSSEEFVYWLGELVGLNPSVWHAGAHAVVSSFNDLAGFKQAKEMALDKLCASRQEKEELAKTIDGLKAKLEGKRPGCAGLFKDLILEILKDIDTLSNPSYRKNDFIWWLAMCVNFEPAVWHAGITQVLTGYRELKDYVRERRELSARFAANPEEEKRLSGAWDNLDKAANFARPASINLLKGALDKSAQISANPREFVFWVGTLSELNTEVLDIFCRDIETVFSYYKEKGKSRDFNHLPAALNQYYKTYHQIILITLDLLDILTEPGVDINARVEKASRYIVEQKIVRLGAPPNLIGLKDVVSFDQLLGIVGEGGFGGLLNYHWQEETTSYDDYGGYGESSYYDTNLQPIRLIVPKMGRDGMYSFWEAQQPPYYRQFQEETRGLAPGFRRPGEKFRVAYDDRVLNWSKEDIFQVMPIASDVEALQQLIRYLRMEWPNLYESFIEPKRDLIKDRFLEEFVTPDTVLKMSQQLLGKVQNWKFSDDERTVFLIKIMEIFAFSETADLRTRINNASEDFNKLRLVAEYWEKVLELILKHNWLQEKSKFYKSVAKIIKQRTATINDKLGNGSEGVMQFYLSGGTVADFFRGIVSCDCTKPGGQAFQNTLGTVVDPGFLLFKIIESGQWAGNIYSVIFKTKDGKFALFVDVFQINLGHPLVAQGDTWNKKRERFIAAFFQEFKSYLASQGFDYLIFANTHSSQKIGEYIHRELVKQSGRSSAESLSLKKPGGLAHLGEGALPVEFVQGVGNIAPGFQSVSGYKIALDKNTAQSAQQRKKKLDALTVLLKEAANEESRLSGVLRQAQKEFNQLNARGREAANSGKNSVAEALRKASEQKTLEINKVNYELQGIRQRMQQAQLEAGQIMGALGLPQARQDRTSSAVIGKFLLALPVVGALNLFLARSAQAQEPSFIEEFVRNPIGFFLTFLGGLGILWFIITKLFSEKEETLPYYDRSFPRRPIIEEYRLPEDVSDQLDRVLEKTSPNVASLIPKKIDIRLPHMSGISPNQAVKALRFIFTKLIKHNSILDFLKGQDFYKKFKDRTSELGLAGDFDQAQHSYFFTVKREKDPDVQYELSLSERNADSILSGIASGDCTSINSHAFSNTIPQFMLDPGFLVFKLLQDGKWVGNVYTIVAQKDNKPILIIDAVQLPVLGREWPAPAVELADKIVEKIIEYAQEQGFSAVLMSSFISNFSAVYKHFSLQYPVKAARIEKVGGFEHLKALGLWDDYVLCNEYLETFSPQWNYSSKTRVNPNNPEQTLLLRNIWEKARSLDETKEDPVPASSPIQSVLNKLKIAVLIGIVSLFILAMPHKANAAKFAITGTTPPQVVAVVEKGDTAWKIAGQAYKEVEGLGKGSYSANLQWKRIYEANPQLHHRPNNTLAPMYENGRHYEDDKHIVVNIRPGDRLVIPGQVNYETTGLQAPALQKPAVPEAGVSQPPVNVQQAEQEFSKLKEQTQTAQADLERLQKQRDELNRQIQELQNQLNDAREQSQALQPIEARRKALEDEAKQLEEKRARYAQEIVDLEKQYRDAQDNLAKVISEREKARAELEQLKQQVPQKQAELNRIREENERLEAQRKQIQDNLSRLQNQRGDLQKSIDQLNQERAELQRDLENLRQQIVEAKKILDEAKQKIQPVWKNVWDGLSLPARIGLILLFITGLGAIAAGIILIKRWHKFKELENKINRLREEAEDLDGQLTPLRAEKDDLVKMKEDTLAEKVRVEKEARKVSQQQTQLEADRGILTQESQDLQKQKEEIEKQKQGLAELDKQKQTVKDEITQLETQRDGLNQALAQAQEEVKKVQSQTQTQINALDDQLQEAREKYETSFAEIEEQKSKTQGELQGLLSEKTKAEGELNALAEKTALLAETQGTLLEGLQDLEKQQKATQENIELLRQEEAGLKDRAEKLRKVREIKPEVEGLAARARAISQEVNSLYLGEEGKARGVDAFVSLVQTKSHSGDEHQIREELKGILTSLGGKIILECGTANKQCGLKKNGGIVPQNLVVEFPGTGRFSKEPGFIINAHMDTVTHSTPEQMDVSDSAKGFFHKINGSFGADDKAGLLVQLEALRFMKDNYWDKGYDHRRIVFIITAEEEPHPERAGFGRGAEHLAVSHPGLFKNILFTLTSDGPLEMPNYDPDRSFVAVVPETLKNRQPYASILETLSNIAGRKGRVLETTEVGLGMGDFAHFPASAKAEMHIRSPYEGNHSNERVKIANLIDHIDLWIAILSRFACDIQDTKTSGIARKTSGNEPVRVLREFIVSEDSSLVLADGAKPGLYEITGILSAKLDKAIAEIMISPLGYKRGHAIKKITVVQGNNRLAEADTINGNIILDIDAFESDNLLALEMEHEFLHIKLDKEKQIPEAIEEISALLFETVHFLSLDQARRQEIIDVMEADNDIDEQGFVKILEKFDISTLDLQILVEDLISYVRDSGVYPARIASYLEGKTANQIQNELYYSIKNYPEDLFIVMIDRLISIGKSARGLMENILLFHNSIGLEKYPDIMGKKLVMSDPFAKVFYGLGQDESLILSPQALSVLNTLILDYNGLTLDIDIDTLIDVSTGMPKLKGLGFKEALASLYQAQEKKEIPANLHVRLINLNPDLNRAKIIKTLGLSDALLKGMVEIPDISQDYLTKGLEIYLVPGSIRIVYEANAKYWGEKIDVLVQKGKETEILSSLGLIVAALSKEPKFYQSLPQELKEYISASTDDKGNIVLDDQNKIKQLIFKPIERTKVDTQYLDRLDKANKELEGMV